MSQEISFLLCIPAFGGQMHMKTVISIMKVVQYCRRANIGVDLFLVSFESLISRFRNTACAQFLGSPHTHLWFIDSDLEFNEESIGRMHRAVIREPNTVQVGEYPPDKLAMGFSVIPKTVLRGIIERHPELKYENDMPSVESEYSHNNFYMFFNSCVLRGEYVSEYDYFWRMFSTEATFVCLPSMASHLTYRKK